MSEEIITERTGYEDPRGYHQSVRLVPSGWHIGANVPGYLPESDVWHVEDWHQAVSSLRDEISRGVDYFLEDEESDREWISEEYKRADTDIGELLKTGAEGAVSFHLPSSDSEWDLGITYWVTECTEAPCEMEEDR